MDIKEKSCFLDFSSENERDTKDLITKIKFETVTSGTKSEPEEDPASSQNEEHKLMRFDETIKESEIENKIYIKEEHWCLEREDSHTNDDIEDETREGFHSIKPPSLYKNGVSTYTSDLFFTEGLENDVGFNMNMNAPECASDRKCQSQESVITVISSIETGVCSETSDGGKIVNMASSLEKSKLFQQNSTNKQQINKNCKSVLGHECGKSYKCVVSKKCFNYSSHLKKCTLILDSNKVSKCGIASKDLNQLSLKTHKLIDEGKRNHKCNIRNKSFTRLQGLKTHKFIHEGIKPHKCNICNKAFTEPSNLKKHKLIHEGLKPHKCDICNTAFTQSSSLVIHKLLHEGIKPHKCNICNKAFTKVSNLNRHKLIHEGIKPHKCNICNRAFTQLSCLKTHKLLHEGIKPHTCNICYKAFTQTSNLKSHKLIHQDK